MTLISKQLRWWTATMLLIAIALATYLTIFIWRRVDLPQNRGNDMIVPHHTEDYAYFYAAGKAMREGQDIYTVQAPGRDRAGYIYPPLIAFLYQPLSRLDLITGARIDLLIDVAALVAALAFASRAVLQRLGTRCDWQAVLTVAVFAALLSFDKIRGELQMLQTNVLVALAMAVGLWLVDRRPFWAGAAIGFAINVKYQALAILLLLLFRRRWKAAGATAVWSIFWGFLPSLSVGFARDEHYLVNGFSGLLRLVGYKVPIDAANVEPMAAASSVSITSAAARIVNHFGLTLSPFAIAGTVAIVWLLALAWLYRSRQVPAIAWPEAVSQSTTPWSSLLAVEWMAVIAAVLAFSPQTNSRHLLHSVLLMVLGVVLIIEASGKTRWLACLGVAIMWAGLNLPPGSRANVQEPDAVAAWHYIGGPTWCLLIGMALLTWIGLSIAQRTTPVPASLSKTPM